MVRAARKSAGGRGCKPRRRKVMNLDIYSEHDQQPEGKGRVVPAHCPLVVNHAQSKRLGS
jgi:hypothetical protein